MFYLAGAFFLAIQTAIAWRVFRNGKHLTMANKLLGDIKMKQDDFDAKVVDMMGKITGLDAKLDKEEGEIDGIVQGYKDEIARLQSLNPNLDTSGLDALNTALDGVGTRIGGLVDPTETGAESPAPVEDPVGIVDEQPPAAEEVNTSVETSVETSEVTKFPTEENQASPATETSSTETSSTVSETVSQDDGK